MSVEEFLTWTRRRRQRNSSSSACQFSLNSASSIDVDCVMLVEFNEIEGPKCFLAVPSSPGAHFDANDAAVWLMAANYQVSSSRSAFTLPQDMQIVQRISDQGIEAYAHYFVLCDVEARGFVRPFCLAYLTKEIGKLSRIFSELKAEVTRMVELVRVCNLRLFYRELAAAIDSLTSVETRAVSTYYVIGEIISASGIYYDGEKSTTEDEAAELCSPSPTRLCRALYSAFGVVAATMKKDGGNDGRTKCVCSSTSSHAVDIERWVERKRLRPNLSEDEPENGLKSLAQLAPCVLDLVDGRIRKLWSKFRLRTAAVEQILAVGDEFFGTDEKNLLYLDSVPLLRVVGRTRRNFYSESDEDDDGEGKNVACLYRFLETCVTPANKGFGAKSAPVNQGENDRLLLSAVDKIDQLLYPLLTGQLLLVSGGTEQRATVVSLINRLRPFVPTASAGGAGRSVLRWQEQSNLSTLDLISAPKIVGFSCSGLGDPKRNLPYTLRDSVSLLSLERALFESVKFVGSEGFLRRAAQKVPKSFKSDAGLTAFLYGLVSEYAACAFVLYHAIYASRDAYARNRKLIEVYEKSLALAKGDSQIVRYFVELVKEGQANGVRFVNGFAREEEKKVRSALVLNHVLG